MRLANNHINGINKHRYSLLKSNKQDLIYQRVGSSRRPTILTELLKIENYQGFSRAMNIEFYLRIKDQSSWRKSTQLTGLWRTETNSILFGDHRMHGPKTLILVQIQKESEELIILMFPNGYYPSRPWIEGHAKELIMPGNFLEINRK